MHITIIAIGKDRRGEFDAAINRYRKQLPWRVKIIEKQPKKPNAPVPERMEEEAQLMLAAAQGSHIRIALDERGKILTSPQFASLLQRYEESGDTTISFFIGGADGLAPSLLSQCDARLSLGSMVYPHQLVRVMLTEQLYRAWSIQTGHPYHRE